MTYGSEALRQHLQEPQEARSASLLEQIPPDAPMDAAAITVWNGHRWVAWDKWQATAPIIREEVSE